MSVCLADRMFWSANIQERVPHVKQMSDPDTAQCPMSQRYCDKMIRSDTMTVHFVKIWKLNKCRRANKPMASSEKVFCGTVGTNAKGKETSSHLGVGVRSQGNRQ